MRPVLATLPLFVDRVARENRTHKMKRMNALLGVLGVQFSLDSLLELLRSIDAEAATQDALWAHALPQRPTPPAPPAQPPSTSGSGRAAGRGKTAASARRPSQELYLNPGGCFILLFLLPSPSFCFLHCFSLLLPFW